MDKYVRLEKSKSSQEDQPIKENEIRITTQGKMRNYISYASNLFGNEEKPHNDVVLKAMGRAINKTVTIAEILKRRIAGLHQITRIDSTDITDVWEPIEEGLDRIETTRHVSSISITLSRTPLDQNDPGYQPPISEDQVKPFTTSAPRGGRGGFRGGRGRGRGFRGGFRGGRGTGRGFRGGFRGGRGRGRGRGGMMAGGEGAPIDTGSPVPANVPLSQDINNQNVPFGNEGGFRGRGRGRGGFRGGRGRGRGFRGGFRGGRGAPRGENASPRFQNVNRGGQQ